MTELTDAPMTREQAEEFTRDLQAKFQVVADELRTNGEDLRRLQKQLAGHENTPVKGHVYFIQAQRSLAIKIGFAVDISKRLDQLQTANAEELTVVGSTPGTVLDEKALHRRFATSHIRGEWFMATSELTSYIQEVSQ